MPLSTTHRGMRQLRCFAKAAQRGAALAIVASLEQCGAQQKVGQCVCMSCSLFLCLWSAAAQSKMYRMRLRISVWPQPSRNEAIASGVASFFSRSCRELRLGSARRSIESDRARIGGGPFCSGMNIPTREPAYPGLRTALARAPRTPAALSPVASRRKGAPASS